MPLVIISWTQWPVTLPYIGDQSSLGFITETTYMLDTLFMQNTDINPFVKKNSLVNNFNNSGHYISKKAMHITSWPQKHLTSLPEKSPCACIVLPHLGTCKSSWVRRNWICWICDDLRSRLKQTWLEKPQICCHSFTIDSCVGIVTRAQNFSNKKRIPIQKSIALDCEDIANNALSLD